MDTQKILLLLTLISFSLCNIAFAADIVPTEIELPGTQPNEVGNFESPDKCDNCHAGYNTTDPEAEPATGWRGSAMGNAGRDPIFWATMAIAEQDFDGSGDLCIRCHSTTGWYGGHSTPTDGSGLPVSADNGVDCDTCHSMTNPDTSDPILKGVMNAPYIANCGDDFIAPSGTCSSNTEGYYGSGMLSLWGGGSHKLGPFSDAEARHQFMPSRFHRDVDFCGSCHDVSNSAVGDLAPGNGAQPGAPHVISSQDFHGGAPNLGGPIDEKAAFNNPPYAYGVVERTFSEYKASALPTTRVSDFNNLPDDLKIPGGSLEVTYQASLAAGQGGDYADGAPRFFSCQSCHMRPTVGEGANKNGVPLRTDLPRHDLTGGNYWVGDVIKYQNSKGHLRLGGDMSASQIQATDWGTGRAKAHLNQAGSLTVTGNTLKVTNLTGHKLISGYPEGRRMWLNMKWYDASNNLLREDGAYGPIGISVANPAGGPDIAVESILDLSGSNTKIYEAHNAMTQDWAETLIAVGKPVSLPLSFDRYSGAVDFTLGDLAALPANSYHETFHFVLNNHVAGDNRIPPYGMSYDEAKKRNALPVPATQYGNPAAGGTYNYFDNVPLNPPVGAVYATIDLLYQGTSWEYIQFLEKANTQQNEFLGQEGINMLEAWLNTGMVPPYVMTSATWGTPPVGENNIPIAADDTYSTVQEASLNVVLPGVLSNDTDEDGDVLTAALLSTTVNGVLSFNADGSFNYVPNAGFTGSDSFTYQASDGTDVSIAATVSITISPAGGVTEVGVSNVSTGYYQVTGKGGNKISTFISTTGIPVGESVVIRVSVTDSNASPVADAIVTSLISGPETVAVISNSSDENGLAEASWQTSAPSKQGSGGTLTGSYTATVSNVSGNWNGVVNPVIFNLLP